MNKTLSIIDASSTPAKAPPSVKRPDTDFGSCGRAGRQQPATIAAQKLVAGDRDLFGRPLDRRSRALAESFALRRQNWIDWPVIGAGLNLPDGRSFDWTPHGTDFRNGTSIAVYASICDGLCDLGKVARLALAKIGISARPNLTARMAEANVDRYGSLYESDGRIVDEPGYDSWEPLRLPQETGPFRLSPVERLSRVLMVSLPASMSVEAFDEALTRLLAHCELSHWIGTADGERHCARLDVDPHRLRRQTAHINATGTIRLKRSRELYVFRRDVDTDRLVMAIEGLIVRHLMALDAASGMPSIGAHPRSGSLA